MPLQGSVTEPSHAAASPIFAPSAAVLLGGHARHAHFDVQRATDAVRGACLASEIVFVSTSRRSPREVLTSQPLQPQRTAGRRSHARPTQLASLCAAALREEVAAGRCTGGAVYDASRDATATVGSLPPLAAPPTSANPLPHFMAVAGALVVSDDSMSMVTEACATAKPVCAVACSRPAYAEAARSAARRLCGRDPANKLAWSLEQLEAEQAVAWVHGASRSPTAPSVTRTPSPSPPRPMPPQGGVTRGSRARWRPRLRRRGRVIAAPAGPWTTLPPSPARCERFARGDLHRDPIAGARASGQLHRRLSASVPAPRTPYARDSRCIITTLMSLPPPGGRRSHQPAWRAIARHIVLVRLVRFGIGVKVAARLGHCCCSCSCSCWRCDRRVCAAVWR